MLYNVLYITLPGIYQSNPVTNTGYGAHCSASVAAPSEQI